MFLTCAYIFHPAPILKFTRSTTNIICVFMFKKKTGIFAKETLFWNIREILYTDVIFAELAIKYEAFNC